MKKLKLLDQYVSNMGRFKKGDVIEVNDKMAQWLMNDAPLCFEEFIEVKEIEEPPQDKAVKSPPRKKSVGRPRGRPRKKASG